MLSLQNPADGVVPLDVPCNWTGPEASPDILSKLNAVVPSRRDLQLRRLASTGALTPAATMELLGPSRRAGIPGRWMFYTAAGVPLNGPAPAFSALRSCGLIYAVEGGPRQAQPKPQASSLSQILYI
eukprot:SAG31_NODE_1424_length_8394_cov_3.211814_2_plen_127_part_00